MRNPTFSDKNTNYDVKYCRCVVLVAVIVVSLLVAGSPLYIIFVCYVRVSLATAITGYRDVQVIILDYNKKNWVVCVVIIMMIKIDILFLLSTSPFTFYTL